MTALNKNDRILIISILALFSFVVAFVFRQFDDNSLTSWQTAFVGIKAEKIFLLTIVGLLLSYFMSMTSLLPVRKPFALFFISFAVSSAFWGEPEVIVDASRYFAQAKHIETYGAGYFLKEWGGRIDVWTDMPAIPFIYGIIFKYFGETRLYIQIFNSLIFSMTTLLVYLIGKDMRDEETGAGAGALLLAMPYLLTQVPLMLVDVTSMFFLTLTVYAFQRALKGGIWSIALSAVVIFISVFSKYSLWLMLSVLIAVFIVRLKDKPLISVYRASAVVLFSVILIGAAFYYKFEVISEQISFLMSYQRPGLKRWSESNISTFFFQIHPFVTVGALYSFYRAYKNKDLKFIIICWLPLLLVLLGVKRIRYLLPAFPMLALMASYGIREIRFEEVRRFIVTSAVICSLVIAYCVYLPLLKNMSAVNLKEAGNYLDTIEGESVEVFTLAQESTVNPAVSVPLLDLFTKKKILYDYEFNKKLIDEIGAPDDVETSSLRFTWQYRNPGYYSKSGNGDSVSALVIISGDREVFIPEELEDKMKGYIKYKAFDIDSGIFMYKTMATVYIKSAKARQP